MRLALAALVLTGCSPCLGIELQHARKQLGRCEAKQTYLEDDSRQRVFDAARARGEADMWREAWPHCPKPEKEGQP